MRNRARLLVALLGLLTFVLVPGIAAAAVQGQNSTEVALASDAAARATALSGLVVNPQSFDFGIVNVGDSPSTMFRIKNEGDVDVTVSDISSDNSNFGVTASLPVVILAGGDFYDFSVAFTPLAGTDETGSITVTSDDLISTSISVNVSGRGNAKPTLDTIADQAFDAFVLRTFTVHARDDNDNIDDNITFTVTPALPPGLTLTEAADTLALGNFIGTFSWKPVTIQAGVYDFTVCAKDDGLLVDCKNLHIVVSATNRPPVADIGGPYSGTAGSPVEFDASGSSDADGDSLFYNWDFGDGKAGTTDSPSHIYDNVGSYLATLVVTDNGHPVLSADPVQTPVNIKSLAGLLVYTKLQGGRLPLDGNTDLLMSIQLVNLAQFPLTSIIQGSLELSSSSMIGTLPSIKPDPKSFVIGDADNNGIPDLSMTFSRFDLRQLTGNIPDGQTVTLTISGTGAGGTPLLAGTGGPYTVKNVGTNLDPAVNAPATATAAHDKLFTMSISAADPDGGKITSLTADLTGLPLGHDAVFTSNVTHTAGTLKWTPTLGMVGTYNATFTAASIDSPATGSATTAISVVQRAPVVTAPANVAGPAGTELTFNVSAVDPDGDLLLSLMDGGLPTGATFTPNGTNTAGVFMWTPTTAQISLKGPGNVPVPYNVTFMATSGAPAQSGSATTAIVVNANAKPVVTAPATKLAAHGAMLTFSVSVVDADGDAISSLAASGSPTGATFTPNGTNTTGDFTWTPTLGQVQVAAYVVTFTATSGTPAQSGSAATAITVTDTKAVVTAPASPNFPANVLSKFKVTAKDPDGDPIDSIMVSGKPSGATFTAVSSDTSEFKWMPTNADISPKGPGNAPVPTIVTFTAFSTTKSASATAAIVVTANLKPVVSAPATKSIAHNDSLGFVVTASDADGDLFSSLTAAGVPPGASFVATADNDSLTFIWEPVLADVNATPYNVTFTATSGTPAQSGSATTAITVTDNKPVVTAPASQSIPSNFMSAFTVLASDPEGDPLLTLTATGLPTGATFTPNITNTSGEFMWMPTTAQISPKGVSNDPVPYIVTFAATSSTKSTSATTAIVVTGNVKPVVSAPLTKSARHANLLKFDVSGSDADGETVSLSADLTTGLPVGNLATFVDNGDETGTFEWTPLLADVSLTAWNVIFTGTAGTPAQSGSATTAITVTDTKPGITYPANMTISTNFLTKFKVIAKDPDGDPISSMTVSPLLLPSGATFTAISSDTSEFMWMPTPDQISPKGPGNNPVPYDFTFGATSTTKGFAVVTSIVVVANGKPVVTASPNLSASGGLPVSARYNKTFTVKLTASDPEGEAINSLTADTSGLPAVNNAAVVMDSTDFAGSGKVYARFTWKPLFADISPTPYTVTFTAKSGTPELSSLLTSETTTLILVINQRPKLTVASAIEVVQSTELKLNVSATDPDGTGIASISANLSALPAGHNAVFTTAVVNLIDLKGTLTWTPNFVDVSPNSYDVVFTAIDGTSKSGTAVSAITVVKSINGSPAIAAAPSTPFSVKIGPNPFNPETAVKYSLSRSGLVSIRIYSVSGRLVRTLKNEFATAGLHEVRWNGKDDSGRSLASGTYFVRTISGADKSVSKIAMLK